MEIRSTCKKRRLCYKKPWPWKMIPLVRPPGLSLTLLIQGKPSDKGQKPSPDNTCFGIKSRTASSFFTVSFTYCNFPVFFLAWYFYSAHCIWYNNFLDEQVLTRNLKHWLHLSKRLLWGFCLFVLVQADYYLHWQEWWNFYSFQCGFLVS